MQGAAVGKPKTLPELILEHSLRAPDATALTFLLDGEDACEVLSYSQLITRAVAIAASLSERRLAGEPVLVLYRASTDYLCALLGCMWAGAIAVPSYPPSSQRLARASVRMAQVVKDTGAKYALTSHTLLAELRSNPALPPLEYLTGDTDSTVRSLTVPRLDPNQTCLLQYTSGSTSSPKGVVLTHSQLCANLQMVADASHGLLEGSFVTWLPPYHDMGLVGTLLLPLSLGRSIVQLTPDAFVRKPIRWLRAITTYRAVMTAAPNFAFDLCMRRIPETERAGLELSSMRAMFMGAEPVRAETLDRFRAAFAPHGLRSSALCPAYGMAEATVFISGGARVEPAFVKNFATDALSLGRARSPLPGEPSKRLVSCGAAAAPGTLRIVDPQRHNPCMPGEVGEIWVQGPAIASGYWRRPDETLASFGARLTQHADQTWLRTGDLGFIADGELFVMGRLKDVIISCGLKYHAVDLELTVQRVDPALVDDAGAAFAVDGPDGEQVCLVHEVDLRSKPDTALLLERILDAIMLEHQLRPHAVVLVKRGSIDKTASGKIMRRSVREQYLAERLSVVAAWPCAAENARAPGERESQVRPVARAQSAAAIERFLCTRIAAHAQLPLEEIDVTSPLARYGVDSLFATELAEHLERWLERPVPSTISYDHPSIAGIARALGIVPLQPTAAKPKALPVTAPNTAAIAIVGMACRLPGANNLQQFWQLLQVGKDAVGEVPSTRFAAASGALRSAIPPRCFGGTVEHLELFDPDFFGIAPREATRMDPQQRLFLEVAWEALEDAGIDPGSLAGSETGVFAGVCGSDHALLHAGDLSLVDSDFGTGHSAGVVPGRVSYFLDLKGPSIAYDSACASSLVALQAACQSLANGEVQLAIVGGVNAILAPHAQKFLSNARALAADGRCKTFDKHADGFVRSEGCGVLILRALPEALSERDRIYALVTGAAVTHGGATNGLMAPNGTAQQRVIKQAQAKAGIDADALDYVEAHGVGAAVADSVELQALGATLAQRTRSEPVWVGSVKTNLGHLEAAAGIASVIKTALALLHEQIPKHLHVRELHPVLRAGTLPLAVPLQAVPWRRSERPRHAGVSAFGFGGTNAHVVLREAPEVVPAAPRSDRAAHLLCLSARSAVALHRLATNYAAVLAAPDAPSLADLCFTAHVGRRHFKHRVAFVAHDNSELQAALSRFAISEPDRDEPSRSAAPSSTGPALWFDPQLPAAHDLERTFGCEPVFRRALTQARAWLSEERDYPLATAPVDGPASVAYAAAQQYALFQLLRAWQITPGPSAGYAAGEFLAAAAAGVLGWQAALRLVLFHAQLRASCMPGAEVTRTLQQWRSELARTPLCAASQPLWLASHGRTVSAGERCDPALLLASIYDESSAELALARAADGCETLPWLALATRPMLPQFPARPLQVHFIHDHTTLFGALGELYVAGGMPAFHAIDLPFERQKVSLPSYPFERKRCWLEVTKPAAAAVNAWQPPGPGHAHPLLRRMTVRSA